jgi:hypothetical protein
MRSRPGQALAMQELLMLGRGIDWRPWAKGLGHAVVRLCDCATPPSARCVRVLWLATAGQLAGHQPHRGVFRGLRRVTSLVRVYSMAYTLFSAYSIQQ